MNKLSEFNVKKDYTSSLIQKLKKRRELNLKLKENQEKEKPVQCSGMNIVDNHLERCTNISNKKYCDTHEEKYKYEKPDDCPVCMDEISDETEIPLSCGHWIHKECLVPTNLHICPICRQKMKQEEVYYVFGKQHLEQNLYARNYYIPFDQGEQNNILENNRINMEINSINLNVYLSDPNIENYIPNSAFYNMTKRDMTEQLRVIFVNARTNNFTYFNNVDQNYYYVPDYLSEKLNGFTNIMITTFIINNSRIETAEQIRNNINNNSTETKKIYTNRLFKFLFNVLIINEFRNDTLITLLSNLTVSKFIVSLNL